MTNEQMKANRFLKWHESKKIVKLITSALLDGKTVLVSTALKTTQFDKPSQVAYFQARKNGAYMARGKEWVCIDFCKITVWRKA